MDRISPVEPQPVYTLADQPLASSIAWMSDSACFIRFGNLPAHWRTSRQRHPAWSHSLMPRGGTPRLTLWSAGRLASVAQTPGQDPSVSPRAKGGLKGGRWLAIRKPLSQVIPARPRPQNTPIHGARWALIPMLSPAPALKESLRARICIGGICCYCGFGCFCVAWIRVASLD